MARVSQTSVACASDVLKPVPARGCRETEPGVATSARPTRSGLWMGQAAAPRSGAPCRDAPGHGAHPAGRRRAVPRGVAADESSTPGGSGEAGDRTALCARGRYALPTASEARRAAGGLSGVVGLRSAAAHHEWPMKSQPEQPEVIVPRNRKVVPERRVGVRVLWTNLAEDQVADGVTTPFRTVIDCARLLPFDEALAIADSALRSGLVTRAELDAVDVRGAGAAAGRRVLRHTDARAANPFESVLRALCLEVGPAGRAAGRGGPGALTSSTRTSCAVTGGPRIEGDSWTWHSTRKAHTKGLRALQPAGHPRVGRLPLHLGAGDARAGVRALGAGPVGRACRTC